MGNNDRMEQQISDRYWGILGMLLVTGFLVLAACAPSQSSRAVVSPSGQQEHAVKETTAPSEAGGNIRNIGITARQFEFSPSAVSVKKGDHVVLTIMSVDVVHGFALPDFGVQVRLNPGVEQVVEFDADKAGRFEFYCSVVCGFGHSNMRGTLVVEE